jgi:hypothetical protein
MGLKVGPVVLGTFIKHYFDRVKSRETADPDELLKQDEILYDEAFHVLKVGCSCYLKHEDLTSVLVFPPRIHIVSTSYIEKTCRLTLQNVFKPYG